MPRSNAKPLKDAPPVVVRTDQAPGWDALWRWLLAPAKDKKQAPTTKSGEGLEQASTQKL